MSPLPRIYRRSHPRAWAQVEYYPAVPKLRFTHPDAVRFGAIFRRLRVARGWTILVAAQRCGMNPNYLGALEKGGNVTSIRTLFEIADVYGVSAADIVREVEEARRAAHRPAAAAPVPPVE